MATFGSRTATPHTERKRSYGSQRISTPHTNTTKKNNNSQFSSAFNRHKRKSPDTNNNNNNSNQNNQQSQQPPIPSNNTGTIPSNKSINHDRHSSLGTIQSNAGTIGTMDTREFNHQSHNNLDMSHNIIRPHITDQKTNKSDNNRRDKRRDKNTKDNNNLLGDLNDSNDDEEDNKSEIPPLPNSTPKRTAIEVDRSRSVISHQAVPSTLTTPIMPSNLTGTSLAVNPTKSKSQLNPPALNQMAGSSINTTAAEERTSNATAATPSTVTNNKKGMYLDDRHIDIDNMIMDPEEDLGDNNASLPPVKPRRIRSNTQDSRKSTRSVRFHESRNTFLSPV